MGDSLAVGTFDPPGTCALCHRILSSEDDNIHDAETISNICGDCKFLFLEDGGTATPLLQDTQRRTPRVRRTRYTNSSESIENIFSQQFSSMINQARSHNQPAVSDLDNQSVDSMQRTSSRTTPSGSRRWWRVVSDTESDGFDSLYGESDVVSYEAYGGDSDASVYVDSFLGDSDTDIDPMHAGLNQWSSDDEEEWEEVEESENTLVSLIARVQVQRSIASNGPTHPVNWLSSPDTEGAVHIRIRERRQVHRANPFTYMEDHSGDYLDARNFEELLERLAEADNSRRGAPPAAVSFVKNLDRVVVNNEEHNGLVCAICKDSLCVGSMVNRLPCLHLYHPWCIKPWLSARNSCPLCRYELPTDDVEYENSKQSNSNNNIVEEMEGEDVTFEEEDESPEIMMNDENGGGGGGGGRGGRWLFVAAPVVSLVGIAVALWLGNSGGIRSCNQRGGSRSRRWWSLI